MTEILQSNTSGSWKRVSHSRFSPLRYFDVIFFSHRSSNTQCQFAKRVTVLTISIMSLSRDTLLNIDKCVRDFDRFTIEKAPSPCPFQFICRYNISIVLLQDVVTETPYLCQGCGGIIVYQNEMILSQYWDRISTPDRYL